MFSRLSLVLVLVLLSLSCRATAQDDARPQERRPARNVILFVADGGGPAHFSMAREMARRAGLREHLYLDAHLVGTVRTHSAKERVTDSASSATAYATGYKTYNGAIAVDTLRRPLRTILEAAEAAGMATGVVATSRITHATPASFVAHVPDRNMENEIAAQMIGQGIDVILGGGRRHFLPSSAGGSREDGRNLLDEFEERGYRVVTEETVMEAAASAPVIGLFEDSHLPYEVDVLSSEHVSLAEMTRKALDLLEDDEDGFFLLVEGSRIDHASHDNDAAAALREVLAYDDAFEVARAFAEEDGETLLLATADHETGGLSAGRSLPSEDASTLSAPTFWRSLAGRGIYDWSPDFLLNVGGSTAAMAAAIEGGRSAADVLGEHAGIVSLTREEQGAVDAALEAGSGLVYVLGEIIARHGGVGWTTTGHTAVDVNLYAFGPGTDSMRGNVDNIDIGLWMFEAIGAEPGHLVANP